MIKFGKSLAQAELLDPLKDFKVDIQQIEHRIDPLTGQTSTVQLDQESQPQPEVADEELLGRLVEESREGCPFCPDKAESTPKFLPDFIYEGRLNFGEIRLFPNPSAQKEYDAIAVLSPRHYLRLDEFTPQLLYDGFKACAFYINKVCQLEAARYAEIGLNYLPPAGASIIHPHLQVMVSYRPHYYLKELSKYSQEHYEAYSINYWDDLIETEKRLGKRYLGATGSTEWYVPFAPVKDGEVRAVVRNKSNFLEFDDSDWGNIADGVSRVLKSYQDKGLVCFNLALYSGHLGEKQKHLWAGLRMVPRAGLKPHSSSDVWFSFLHLDGATANPPEELTSSLREYFG